MASDKEHPENEFYYLDELQFQENSDSIAL